MRPSATFFDPSKPPRYTFYGYRISDISDYITFPPFEAANLDNLPNELKCEILKYVLPMNQNIDAMPCTESETKAVQTAAVRVDSASRKRKLAANTEITRRVRTKHEKFDTGAMYTCHALHDVCTELIYHNNHFELLGKPWDKAAPMWLDRIGIEKLGYLKSLSLTVQLSGYFDGEKHSHPTANTARNWINFFGLLAAEGRQLKNLHLEFAVPSCSDVSHAAIHNIGILRAIAGVNTLESLRVTGKLPTLHLAYLIRKMDQTAFQPANVGLADCYILPAIAKLQAEAQKLVAQGCTVAPRYQHLLSFDTDAWEEAKVRRSIKGNRPVVPLLKEVYKSGDEVVYRRVPGYVELSRGVQIVEEARQEGLGRVARSKAEAMRRAQRRMDVALLKMDVMLDFWAEMEELGLVREVADGEEE